ncbi:MAG: hypothetical protein IPG45_03905 [Deltaproteobacteria bacterium]|nr:hypothetical protein [Deltaproteobacteria bacterium]
MGNKGMVYGLAAALVVALLVIAYLLGQRSAGPQVVWSSGANATPAAPSANAAPAEPEVRPSPATPTFADPPPDDVVLVQKNGTVSLVSPTPTARPDTKAPPPAASTEVSEYLDQVTRLTVGPVGTDQQAFAQQLLGESMGGDLSGFDDLIREAEAAERAARAITPPPAAAEHHRQLLGLLGESRRILQAEKEALAQKDPALLTGLLASAQSLEAKAKALAATEAQLRRSTEP